MITIKNTAKYVYIAATSLALFGATALADNDNENGRGGSNGDTSSKGDASINVTVPLQISQTKALNFGQVIRSNNLAGTVTVNRNGQRTGTNVVLDNNADVSIGQFDIFGEKNRIANVSMDKNVTLINENSERISLVTDGEDSVQKLGGDAKAVYKVGGTVSLSQNQAAGNYRGTYNITVSY